MLGLGCPHQNHCKACKSLFNQKNYCNNKSNGEAWRKCPERPLNSGDENIQRNYQNKKSKDTTLGWLLILTPFAIWLIYNIIDFMSWH